jgi:hypothetical protein
MKKKLRRRLVINKETVANLSNSEQLKVKAGYISATCPDFGCDTDGNCTIGCPSVNWRYCNPTADPECATLNSYCPAPPCNY